MKLDDVPRRHKARLHRRLHRRLALAAAAVGLLLAGGAARAAPFCVVVAGLPDECLYVDATACNSRAARLHGRCGLNPDAPALPREGGEPFCEVESSAMLSCLYPDAAHCAEQSARDGTACVEAPATSPASGGTRQAGQPTDPYRQIRPYGSR